MSFVLDTSLAIAWSFQDETTAQSDELLDRVKNGPVYVPALWEYEVTNAVLTARRNRRISDVDVRTILNDLDMLPITVDRTMIDLVALSSLAQEYKLTAYDAAYLELAIRKRLPLATLDKALIKASQAAGVERA